MAAIGCLKNTSARERHTVIAANEIDIVHRAVRAEPSLDPAGARIFGNRQKAAVAAYPTTLRVNEIDCVQITAARGHPRDRPAALRMRNSCADTNDNGK